MKTKDFIILGSAVAIYLLWKNNKGKKQATSVTGSTGTETGGAGAGNTGTGSAGGSITPTSNEPEQVYGLNLPTGMDLPVLTGGTGVPTEVALQSGLGDTAPTPAIVPPKPKPRSLILDGLISSAEKELLQAPTINGSVSSEILSEPVGAPRTQTSLNPRMNVLEP